jgi:hypothetical protein
MAANTLAVLAVAVSVAALVSGQQRNPPGVNPQHYQQQPGQMGHPPPPPPPQGVRKIPFICLATMATISLIADFALPYRRVIRSSYSKECLRDSFSKCLSNSSNKCHSNSSRRFNRCRRCSKCPNNNFNRCPRAKCSFNNNKCLKVTAILSINNSKFSTATWRTSESKANVAAPYATYMNDNLSPSLLLQAYEGAHGGDNFLK